MVHVIIGLIVGIIMGLTGAGGALISIPMFLALLGSSLKEATVLSLVAVLIGAVINLYGSFTQIDRKVVLGTGMIGTLVNYLTIQFKDLMPDWLIASLLSLIAVYGLWSIWRPQGENKISPNESVNYVKILTIGVILGLVTTITGLGGGVLLVPLLIRLYGKTYQEALPTSLATIFLVSLSALIFQGSSVMEILSFQELGLLGTGTVIAFVFLKTLLKHVKSERLMRIRQIVFSLVTVYSVGSVLLKVI